MIRNNGWECKNKRFTKRYIETSWERKNNTNKRLRWAHNHEIKRKYRMKKIEEKEKVSTQNKKTNKRFTKRYMETSWEKKISWAHNLEMKKKAE